MTGDGFSLDVPANPTGSFTVTVKLAGATSYRGYSVMLAYDASLLNVTSVDAGTVLGTSAFCTPAVAAPGNIAWGCTELGSGSTSASGSAGVVHFQVLGSGTVHLHLVTYDEDTNGTFLVVAPGGDPAKAAAVRIATHDADVTVAP